MRDLKINNEKISVIIPVYNAEPYLRQCLDSVINQTYGELEILLVDDGSTDLSGKICDEYGELDQRVKVFHEENQGAPCARNAALKEATGKWISFIDADDWIESTLYEEILETKEEDTDLVIFDKYIFVNNEWKPVYEMPQSFSSADRHIIGELQLSAVYKGFSPYTSQDGQVFIWNKLYKKELIDKNNLKFPNDVYGQDDRYFNTIYLGQVRKIQYLHKAFYYYRILETSISHKYTPNRIEWDNALYRELVNIPEEKIILTDLYMQAVYARVIENVWAGASRCFFHSENTNGIVKKISYVNNVLKTSYYKEAFSKIDKRYLSFNLNVMICNRINMGFHIYIIYMLNKIRVRIQQIKIIKYGE